MKYAFMSFSAPEASLEDLLDLALRYGFDGVEPRLCQGHGHGISRRLSLRQRARARALCEDRGVGLSCLATLCSFSDPRCAERHHGMAGGYAELAADLGCPSIRVFGGVIPDGQGRCDAITRISDALRWAGDAAAAHGVSLCVETHDDWANPEDMVQLMQRTGHPAVEVTWDVVHPLRQSEASLAEVHGLLRPWIRHVHIHDARFRHDGFEVVPIGEGECAIATAVRLLGEDGYDGYISGEWIDWQPPDIHLPRELAALRSLEAAAGASA